MKKINVFYKETMGHYHPESYDGQAYEVKKWDTLYSVLNYIWQENWIPKNLIKLAINTVEKKWIKIKPGDKIFFELQDNNSAELIIIQNWKEHIYTIRNSKENEVIDATNTELNTIIYQLNEVIENQDEYIKQIWKKLLSIINSYRENLEYPKNTFENLVKIEQKLYSPKYRNNPEAKKLIWIINILTLQPEQPDIENDLVKSFEIQPMLNRHKLAKFLANDLPNYSLKGTKIANNLITKYPKYNFYNSYTVSDPEWWEPIETTYDI